MEVNGRFCAQDICVFLPDCQFTGTSAFSRTPHFKISPNPANKEVKVIGTFEPDARLSIITASGKVVETSMLESNEIMLDVSYLKSGAYIMIVQQSTGTLQQSFIKE